DPPRALPGMEQKPVSSAPFSPELVSSFFMPSMSPQPTQAAAPAAVMPDVLSLADVRKIAKSVIDKHFRGRVDPAMVTAMVEIESGFNRKAYRYEPRVFDGKSDASYGLMQNLYRTNARWHYDERGKRAFALNAPEDLYDPATAIYFGAATIDWLRSHSLFDGTEDWLVMAYNGGPGGVGGSTTPNHLAKYKAAKARQAQVK
ncbi:MAG: transglycosylase SLT domain-containing protein, partial [Parvibaculum sp.]